MLLDRDDTLIRNVPYLGDASGVEVLPGVPEALVRLRKAGFILVGISNQSGVGRRLITLGQVEEVNAAMQKKLGEGALDALFMCFDDPSQGRSNRRKPSPAMVFEAAGAHDIDLSQSFIVGDRLSDVECGKNAGCRSILILSGRLSPDELASARALADFAAPDLGRAADWILAETG